MQISSCLEWGVQRSRKTGCKKARGNFGATKMFCILIGVVVTAVYIYRNSSNQIC